MEKFSFWAALKGCGCFVCLFRLGTDLCLYCLVGTSRLINEHGRIIILLPMFALLGGSDKAREKKKGALISRRNCCDI